MFVCFRLLVMQGWFDAFRNNGGPTLYNFNNRTAVTGDVTLITFLVIFSTIYVAFLVIFPGIRKEVRNILFSLSRKYLMLTYVCCIVKVKILITIDVLTLL